MWCRSWGIISSQGRLVIVLGTLWFLYDLRGVGRQHRWCVFHVSQRERQRHGCNTLGIEERHTYTTELLCVCSVRIHTNMHACKALVVVAKKEEWQVSNADGSGKHPSPSKAPGAILTVCLDPKNGSIFHQPALVKSSFPPERKVCSKTQSLSQQNKK